MKILLIIIIIVLSASFAGAEMYQWIADDGPVTFQDTQFVATYYQEAYCLRVNG